MGSKASKMSRVGRGSACDAITGTRASTLRLRQTEPAALLYGDLLGASPVMRELFTQLARLEGSKVNLLISGESGTGKELIARALHDHSAVGRGPFVAVNCGGLDHHLARSELFG